MEQRIGPAQRIPPPRVEVPEEIVGDSGPGMDPAQQDTTPVPLAKHVPEERVASLSRNGLTLDSHIIVDGQSISIRNLWDAGAVVPRRYRRPDGAIYEAVFTDRVRSVVIHKETFDVMIGEQLGDSDAKPELSAAEQVAVDAGVTPEVIDALKMVEHGPWENEVRE